MKFTEKEKIKIQNRYNSKFEEFIKLSKETLAEVYDDKMSSTDRKAFEDATRYLMYKEYQEQQLKENNEESKDVLSTEEVVRQEVDSNLHSE